MIPPARAPAGWLEARIRGAARPAAGQIVPGEVIMRELHQTIARLEDQTGNTPRRRRAAGAETGG
jgi:hypothetical protein